VGLELLQHLADNGLDEWLADILPFSRRTDFWRELPVTPPSSAAIRIRAAAPTTEMMPGFHRCIPANATTVTTKWLFI
jgi:hypothetical protein